MKTTSLDIFMRKALFSFLFLAIFMSVHPLVAQPRTYQSGEWLKLRIHYGWFNASFATIQVNEKYIGDTMVYHVLGEGKSTGLLHAFYKVDDTYQSYIDPETELPIQFFRNINEGGYTKNKIIWFNQMTQTAKVRDLKRNTEEEYETVPNVQDMISIFYYVRDQIDEHLINEGDEIEADMFFDEKNYKFKTVYLGQEILKTKFGKIKTLKLRPYVQAGRVFKEQESLTVWISADENKVPIRIKAKLAVGSLTADLDEYKGLKYPLKTE